jgi:hypothetical protein
MTTRNRSERTRRKFLRDACLTPLALTASKTSVVADGTRPHIVFILADDLGSAEWSLGFN